jgi:hypothetical protein
MKTIEDYADFIEEEDGRTEFLIRVRKWNSQIDDMSESQVRTLLKLMIRSVGNTMNFVEELLVNTSLMNEEYLQDDEGGAIDPPTSDAAAELGELVGEGRAIG